MAVPTPLLQRAETWLPVAGACGRGVGRKLQRVAVMGTLLQSPLRGSWRYDVGLCPHLHGLPPPLRAPMNGRPLSCRVYSACD